MSFEMSGFKQKHIHRWKKEKKEKTIWGQNALSPVCASLGEQAAAPLL